GILTRSYLTQNPTLIREANPSLSPAQIQQVLFLTIQYHLLQIHVHQLERASKAPSIQHFAECIAVYKEFDPSTEPEVVLFQSRTGKSLRPQQADLLNWEMETAALEPVRLFAAPAGDGKTTLYIPIAMQRLQRLGFVPFSASSKALYGVDREGLKTTSQHVFSFEVDVLELALSTEATADDFKWFYKQLRKGSKNGFKIIPEVYYALDLKYQLALEQESVEEVRWLRRIFAYLEEHGAILVDECRQNCSPFTQAKIGIGKPLSLPAIDRKAILQIYRLLLSPTVRVKDGRTLRETVRLQENLQATMNDEERAQVKEVILKQLTEESAWLQVGQEERKRAIELINIYFEEFFNTAMSLVWRMNHVHSIKEKEEVHVPARNRQATRAYFDEVYLTLMATIQGVLQEGLSQAQAQKLFEELEMEHSREVGASGRISEIETSLRTWVHDPDIRLSHFSGARAPTMEQFHRLLHRNPEAIFSYLEKVLLQQVQYSPEQLTVTPIHFLHGFKQVTLFSADPGPEEIYGIYQSGKGVRKDPQFMAHAVHQFLTPENSQYMTFPVLLNARSFFDTLLEYDPKIFSHLRMICDAGGMLRNFTVTELLHAFNGLEIALDGLIMFEEASNKEEETNLFVCLRGAKKPLELKGHDIPAALRSLGYNWEKLKLLTIIDPSHRAGANIEQPKGSSVLVLAGEGLTLSDDVQGKLRGRGVLKREQKIIWGVAQKLAPMIATPITPQSTLEWEMRNESNIIDKEVLLSAFQQIDYWIEAPVRQKLHAEDDPHKQIAIWKRHRRGFVKQAAIDPILRFKGKRTFEATATVLLNYAQQKYEEFQFKTPWKKATSLHTTLEPIIAAVAKRQAKLSTSATIDSRQHCSVHTFQRQEMKKECVTDAHTDLTPEEPIPLSTTLSTHNFVPQLLKHARTAQEVFGSSHLTEGLYFTENALFTAKTGGQSLGETYLKPVQYILVVKDDKKWTAFALSDEEAIHFQNELLAHEPTCRIALLSADGHIAQNGKGSSQFSKALLKETFVQDVVIDVGLTSCTPRHPLRFIERIEHWDDFWPMWQNIISWQPMPHLVQPQGVEKFVPERIKKIVTKTESKKSSWLSWLYG
ncbi:hypothetical protein ACFLR2_01070, partial [Chlamydiota bacterium]